MYIRYDNTRYRTMCDSCGYIIEEDQPMWHFSMNNGKNTFKICTSCGNDIPKEMQDEYERYKLKEKKYYDRYTL